jgi:V8-like Glu-specific endopeptidase
MKTTVLTALFGFSISLSASLGHASDPQLEPRLRGDFDGDGEVTLRDGIRLKEFLHGKAVEPASREALDVNADGIIDNADVLGILMLTGDVQGISALDAAGKDPLKVAGREVLEGMEDFQPALVVSRGDFREGEGVAADDLEKIDNGDGTWSYSLPEGFDASLAVAGNLVTWQYAGQARFSHDAKAPTSTRHHVVEEEVKLTERQKLGRMKRIDSLGRIWRVAAIDAARWEEVSAPDPVELEDDSLETTPRRTLERELAPGTVIPWQPMSWDHENCDGITGKDVHLWDGESRVAKFPSSLSDKQKTAVQVFANGALCSGVIIHQDEILTAAHCVSDDNNNPVPLNTVTVCRYDTGECLGAADIDFSGSYGGGSGNGGGTDFGDDWAIIELSGSWTTTAEDMDLSSASDTTISNLDNLKNIGFPGFAPTCGAANGNTLYYNKELEPVAGITSKKLKMKIDGAPGQSGSPIYYCPDGDNDECQDGETGFVIGVFAGWDSVGNRFVGPKVPDFKSSADVFLND